MPTIRYLLDRYGQPPPELVLDWAWQMRRQLDGPERCDAEVESGDRCLLACRVWTELEVADDGQLTCDDLDHATARRALEDLQQWAGCELPLSGMNFQPSDNLPQNVQVTQNQDSSSTVQIATGQRALHRVKGARAQRGLQTLQPQLGWSLVGAAALILLTAAVVFWPSSKPDFDPAMASATGLKESTGPLVAETASWTTEPAEPSSEAADLESLTLVEPDPTMIADQQTAPPSLAAAQLEVDSSLSAGSSAAVPQLRKSADSDNRHNSLDSKAADGAWTVADANRPTAPRNSESETKDESLREVNQMFTRAEAEETILAANRHRGVMQDTHGEPWVLSRDTMRYRVNLSPQLNVSTRESQWTLALEPIAGLVLEPPKPVTIAPRGLAVWRIYEAEAKSPRACLFVRAIHRGRDGELELAFYGGAEDMPGMSVPLGARWLEPLTVRVQSHAIELRGALSQLSTSVITRDQVPAVAQRKQAMLAQMFTATRLGVIMPEINRLAQLVDGQVTMHAALKSKPDEPPIATWGRLP